jgi:hypothetical protein
MRKPLIQISLKKLGIAILPWFADAVSKTVCPINPIIRKMSMGKIISMYWGSALKNPKNVDFRLRYNTKITKKPIVGNNKAQKKKPLF